METELYSSSAAIRAAKLPILKQPKHFGGITMPKRTSSYKERLLEDLRDPEEAANYINSAIQDGTSEMLLLALRDVAEAHKMAKVAKGTGVAREAIYRILSHKGN